MATVAAIAESIYKKARKGTSVNPGLPDLLSEFVVAMTKHETATNENGAFVPYSSNAFLKDNNAIGYKYVKSRYQTGPGIKSSEGDPYGHYATYLDCIDELIDWIYRRRKEGIFPADLSSIKTAEQFAVLLKKAGYYGSTVEIYLKGLKHWFVEFGNTSGSLLIAAGITVLLLAYYKMK